jgi:hypothetical protein
LAAASSNSLIRDGLLIEQILHAVERDLREIKVSTLRLQWRCRSRDSTPDLLESRSGPARIDVEIAWYPG